MTAPKSKWKLSVAQQGTLLIALPFLAQLVLAIGYWYMADRIMLQAQHEDRSQAIIADVNWIVLLLSASQNCSYAFTSTRRPDILHNGQACLKLVSNELTELSARSTNKTDAEHRASLSGQVDEYAGIDQKSPPGPIGDDRSAAQKSIAPRKESQRRLVDFV